MSNKEFKCELDGLKLDFIRSFRNLDWRMITGNALYDFLKGVSISITVSGLGQHLLGNELLPLVWYVLIGVACGLFQGCLTFTNEIRKPVKPRYKPGDIEVVRTGSTTYEVRAKERRFDLRGFVDRVLLYCEYNYIKI